MEKTSIYGINEKKMRMKVDIIMHGWIFNVSPPINKCCGGVNVREAMAKIPNPFAKGNTVEGTSDDRSKYDINDIKLDPSVRPVYYLDPAKFPAKKADDSQDVRSGPNIIDNEEDKPQTGIIVTELHYKLVELDGLMCRQYTDIWNDSGLAGSGDLDTQGTGDCFFFHASTKFLTDAAKKYAGISDQQDFKYRPTKDHDFVCAAISFLKGDSATKEEVKSVQKQMDAVVKELAGRMKTGDSTDLHTLKSKITIEGTDMTIGDLLDMQQSLNGFEGVMKTAFENVGTGDRGQFGKLGMMKPLIHAYAQNFAPNLRKGVESAFDQAADGLYKKAVDYQENWHAQTQKEDGGCQCPNPYFTSNAYYGNVRESFYQIFSNLDSSSKGAMTKDFENRMQEFSAVSNASDRVMGVDDTSFYAKNLRSLFNQAIQWIK